MKKFQDPFRKENGNDKKKIQKTNGCLSSFIQGRKWLPKTGWASSNASRNAA